MNAKPRWRVKGVKVAAIAALVLTQLLIIPAHAKKSFLIAPGRLDFDLSKPNTQTFIITNTGDQSIRLAVDPVYFPIDSKSLAAGKPLVQDKPIEDDIREYIRVSPRAISLRPGQRRDLRISVKAPPELRQGDYRAHLLVQMKEVAATIESTAKDSQRSVGMKLDIKMETAVAIYGHLGERDPTLEFSCYKNDKGNLALEVTNPSQWRFDGWVDVYTAKNSEAPYNTLRVNSLRESVRAFHSESKAKPSEVYTLKWKDLDASDSRGTATCRVEP